jgi:hypothetical protein
MIQLKPNIAFQGHCPHCDGELPAEQILWQGIHICAICKCINCGAEIVADLGIGQAIYTPYMVDLGKGLLFGGEAARLWFGEPLLKSLQHPNHELQIELNIDKKIRHSKVIILNCLDFLYGHALLKLLNAEAHLIENMEVGLIILVPCYLRWMVPVGVAEVWEVNISLSQAQNYYPRLDKLIKTECERFDEIYVSYAHSHPRNFDITCFSGVGKHDFSCEGYRITFIWREDRPWLLHHLWVRVGLRLGVVKRLLLKWQNHKVCCLFSSMRLTFPEANFTVAGLGTATGFPVWVDDQRVDKYDDVNERQMCKIYAESKLVIGVHGSNMLLPSAHAGMTIDLMPEDRWGNFAQDVLYQENDSRLAAYRYRYIPMGIEISALVLIATNQLSGLEWFMRAMTGKRVDNSR